MKTTSNSERGDATREHILAAAQTAFATVGFEGASLRGVSSAAGIQHTLLLYHFKTKEVLWQAVMERYFGNAAVQIRDALAGRLPSDPAEALREIVRVMIQFFAAHPELHRIITLEAQQESPRLCWLVEHFARPSFAWLSPYLRATRAFTNDPADDVYWFYVLIAMTATPFTQSRELRLLTGRDVFDAGEVERLTALITRILLD